jgi:hypothetical protein
MPSVWQLRVRNVGTKYAVEGVHRQLVLTGLATAIYLQKGDFEKMVPPF